jgi:hypothetical protein
MSTCSSPPCRTGTHRCAALALWFLDNALARRIVADRERKMKETGDDRD